jgi:hypothetical protein
MTSRLPTLLVLSALFAVPALARGEPTPSSTDEARALAGSSLPRGESPRPFPAGTVVSSTDEARAFAGRVIRPATATTEPARSILLVSSTDDARAVAGGLLAVASARRSAPNEMLAHCGKACDCRHP